MTRTTETVFEKYQIRKSKKQKENFCEYVKTVANDNGYSVKIEKGYFGAKNIVVGDVDSAKVVFTAHYDTCSKQPFPNFITPKNFLIHLLYQIAIVAVIIIAGGVVGSGMSFLLDILLSMLNIQIPFLVYFLLMEIPIIGVLLLFFAGPANKHTANDNTSGVTTLLDIMLSIPCEERQKAAFVFFDMEELGTFGSAGFASKHPNVRKNKLLINFDCVSDGHNFLFVIKKGAVQYKKLFEECFVGDECFKVELADKGVFYPSDQANFKCGVGVAALKRTRNSKLLYMDRIHTKRDVIYQEENIEFLKNGSICLVKKI